MSDKPKYRKKKRERIVSLFSFLPLDKQAAIDHWLRGRKQYREIKNADFVFVSPPKAGRTWLRVTLSGFFQTRFGTPAGELLGFDNLHRINADVPRIRFTDDRYVSAYTGNRDSKRDYYNSRVLLLVRDPRDIAVSNYFQWVNTVNPYKKKFHKLCARGGEISLFEYAMDPDYGIPRTIRFLNGWQPELEKTRDHLVISYEEMRANPQATLKKVISFMNITATDEQIVYATEYASMENMRKIEKSGSTESGSRRLMPKDLKNPDAFKARRGKVGGYRDYFSAAELARIDEMVATGLSPFYGYSEQP
jgi:hypothetical protein